MRPLSRRAAALVVALAATVPLLVSCGSSAAPVRRIAILRAVASGGNESALFDGLARGGIDRKHIRIIGGASATEVHATLDDASAAVKRWVAQGVDAIVALSTTDAMAASTAAPANIPVLFLSNDPSATGLLRDERRPEGHLTGMSYRVPSDRTLAVAADAFPGLHKIGCVYTLTDPAATPAFRELERGTRALGLQLDCASFTGANDVSAVTKSVVERGIDAFVVLNAPTISKLFPQLEQVLVAAKVPVIANQPCTFAEITLQPDGRSVYMDLGRQLARALRGAKVADVPVQDPAHFMLVVSTKAAAAIGRTIPDAVVRQATQVVR